MKNRINLAAACLHLISFFYVASIVYVLINYASLGGGQDEKPTSVLTTLIVPTLRALLLGVAFHYCAKFLKRGNAKAWKYSVILMGLSLFKVLGDIFTTSVRAELGIGDLGLYAIGLFLPGLGLWALLQKDSRDFVNPTKAVDDGVN
ncbi:hypothetical protein FXN63_18310 [Pigmentiphaga aceris]|uniref:Uncharacterized protein n=1 Tax=Pigmentiphaga aceris TaxID=1940612 RepID=A0A5C0B446_9BURK|nr:hypothetical protein [Pigmentiphaga aceris]QEI07571.1 hypothetical protein FXN63_18310 [Pigmentiphaga aceris]